MMVNRILKREIRFWAQQQCGSEVRRCLGHVIDARGFRGAKTLIDKIFRHQPPHSEDKKAATSQQKEFVIAVLDNMNQESKARPLKQEPLLDEGNMPMNPQLQTA